MKEKQDIKFEIKFTLLMIFICSCVVLFWLWVLRII
jgi:hypothetical protein